MQKLIVIAALRTALINYQYSLVVSTGGLFKKTGLDCVEMNKVKVGRILFNGSCLNVAPQAAIDSCMPHAIQYCDAEVIIAGIKNKSSCQTFKQTYAWTARARLTP